MPPTRYIGVAALWCMLLLLPHTVRAAERPARVESAEVKSKTVAYPEERLAARALAVGFSVGVVGLGAGGYLATSRSDLSTKHSGIYIAHAGLALAPFAAHASVGEWGRGAAFSVLPTLGALGMAGWLSARPAAPIKSEKGSFFAFPLLLGVSVISSAIGISDAAWADSRKARAQIVLEPNGESARVSLGGFW